jgi:hypothetical protein
MLSRDSTSVPDESVFSGIAALDEVVQGLRLGDNVVWQVDSLEDYIYFVRPFVEQAVGDGRVCIYLRFAPHPPLLQARAGLEIVEVDPSPGFDYFAGEVQHIIQERGRYVFYVFDSLSELVKEWATDELLANFFQVTCPFLFELETVTYFALMRGKHAHSAVARIRDTTQLLVDIYHAKGAMYMHPLKVWARYSPDMFLPHEVEGESWQPVFQSGALADLATARRKPLRTLTQQIAPWETVYEKLVQYPVDAAEWPGASPEIVALKQELARMMIGNHPEFNELADRYLPLADLFRIRERVIGSGRIGGKAAGMLVARAILTREKGEIDFSKVLENHDSFFIGSDVFFTFLVNNNLFRLRLQLSRNSQISHEEFDEVEWRFLSGKFPPEIVEQFRDMLDYYGQAPIIARSSSLLEDSFGNAFAGKYRSEFCVNQGSPDRRLEQFMNAVKLVYASALNPDALSYRRRRGLGESDEQMAILVQRVAGMRYKNFFFPSLAGVAFSRNLYAWSNRIDPKKGMIRLVFGLGTRAVNRVGGDYPRMIAVSHPKLRPEVGQRISKYSQREADLLDLESNNFVTLPVADIIAERDYPNLHLLVSVMRDGYVYDPLTGHAEGGGQHFLTFNNLIDRTDFVRIMGDMLARLERVYGHPIDTEFTASIDEDNRVRVNLLQCRPMWVPGAVGTIVMPEDIPPDRVLFRSNRLISGGVIHDIRFILYIDPRKYAQFEDKKALGRIVGRVNQHPEVERDRIIMMGPGRWGSSNIDLGVNASYSDIDNASILVEIAREESGQVPEVSYGTHFFQDLVEAEIVYLPVYPDDPSLQFNEAFFEHCPNVLAALVPEAKKFADIVKLIDVPACRDGRRAHVIADPHSQKAVCYLE